MIIRHLSVSQIITAAEFVGLSVNIRTLNAKGDRHQVKVNPGDEKDANGDRSYQRIILNLNGGERRVAAVCWHGFRDFFRACFEFNPDAVFRTSLDVWAGLLDFEARFAVSGQTNIGSQFRPLRIADACRCPDRGECS